MHVLDSRPRLDARLDERPAGLVVGGQRGGLLAAAVQGQHQQNVEVFPERLVPHQAEQLAADLSVPSQVKAGLQLRLQALPPDLLQVRGLTQHEPFRGHVHQRLAPPERQRGT